LSASLASFKATVEKLIRRFESDRPHYFSNSYSEAQARVDFITPFFKALGWDVENDEGLPHHSREVLVEAAEDTRGRPDYSFRVAGQTKFFVEAKAPSEELDAARHIVQAKSYAWNTKQVFFVVLTDFEEFRFYDASIQPDERKPDEGLLLKLKYTDYLAKAAKLWEFSRERVSAGSLEAWLPRDRRTQRLRIPVDAAFLDEMTGWREELARNVYKNSPNFTAKQLNEVVQRLLDRIVFIRIAEDRRVIEKNQLRDVVEEWKARGAKFHIFDWLRPLFEKINEDFNGEIFKPNELLETTRVDSEVLARIIERLYPPKSPYRFDVIGVELLGSIYERYLGKTIRPTAKTVRVEEKPEVRKAGGVYYTPKYIVDYIVKNTVGKTVEGKAPKQIEKIRILDPACGSGSFLIGAFQYLIDYHVRYLTAHPREAHVHPLFPDLVHDANGGQRLSVRLKAKILKNNLYGVDIDPQAVEITMMSLYLKALEGEKSQLPPKQALLPELKYNIICGNSLIGPDIYDQGTLFADAERDRINAFDWNSKAAGFGQIMKDGGFDCVIGNPPWVMAGYYLDRQLRYLRNHFKSAQGKFDLYYLFLERALALTSEDGLCGMIVPNKFFHTKAASALRALLSNPKSLRHVVDFGEEQIFSEATNYSCIVIAGRRPVKTISYAWARSGLVNVRSFAVAPSSLSSAPWNFEAGSIARLFKKIGTAAVPLAQLTLRFGTGVQSGADRILTVDAKTAGLKHLEKELLRPLLRGRDVRRYMVANHPKLLIFPYNVQKEEFAILAEEELRRHRRIHALMMANRNPLARRVWFGKGAAELSGKWYGMMYLDSQASFAAPHLLTPSLSNRSNFALGTGDLFATGTAGVTSIIPRPEMKESIFYLLGLLNSSLMSFYIVRHSPVFSGAYYKFSAPYLKQLPIHEIDPSNPADKAHHDKIVRLVEQMLALNKRKHSGKLAPSQLGRVEREIAATDAEIDDLVFKLYRITEKQRKIIEGMAHE
jgi:hypothetical protein